jgi:hypothetical protein
VFVDGQIGIDGVELVSRRGIEHKSMVYPRAWFHRLADGETDSRVLGTERRYRVITSQWIESQMKLLHTQKRRTRSILHCEKKRPAPKYHRAQLLSLVRRKLGSEAQNVYAVEWSSCLEVWIQPLSMAFNRLAFFFLFQEKGGRTHPNESQL